MDLRDLRFGFDLQITEELIYWLPVWRRRIYLQIACLFAFCLLVLPVEEEEEEELIYRLPVCLLSIFLDLWIYIFKICLLSVFLDLIYR